MGIITRMTGCFICQVHRLQAYLAIIQLVILLNHIIIHIWNSKVKKMRINSLNFHWKRMATQMLEWLSYFRGWSMIRLTNILHSHYKLEKYKMKNLSFLLGKETKIHIMELNLYMHFKVWESSWKLEIILLE